MGFLAPAAFWTSETGQGLVEDAQDFSGSLTGAKQAADAAKAAAETQATAAEAGIAEQRRQFDATQTTMAPFVEAGGASIAQQMDMLGLNGPERQAAAMDALQGSTQFAAMIKQGENALLQSAAATGGLRGGDLQSALAQFRPQTLASLFQQRIGSLGGLTQIGQASAAGQAAQGMESAGNIANLLGQAGAATAGGQLAAGNQWANTLTGLSSLGGAAIGVKKAGLF